jgi:hypothetical protein
MYSVDTSHVVVQELEHIPRGSIVQNAFRAAYNAYRRHDLSLDPLASPDVALAEAEALVRQVQPTFVPQIDRDYFFACP